MKHYLLCIGLFMTVNKVASNISFASPPKNIIFLIGNGMGLTQLSMAMHLNNDQSSLTQFPITGLQIPTNLSSIVPEPAACATAIATGTKTYHGAIGLDQTNNQVESFLQLASDNNVSTALITTSNILDPNIAAFFAHLSLKDSLQIPSQFPTSEIDVYIGGGQDYFNPGSISELEENGYQLANYEEHFFKDKSKSKWFLFTTEDNKETYFPYAIKDVSQHLKINNKKGFVLIGSSAQISKSAQLNNIDDLQNELKDFDDAIAAALAFAQKDGETLVIVTAGVESGGLAINPGSTLDSLITEFTTTGHTGSFLPVFAYGPGATAFNGVYDNTAIYDKILKIMGWEE
jgi:alkaline phosphatase